MQPQDGNEIDMKDTAGLLTLDAIATGGFGIQVWLLKLKC